MGSLFEKTRIKSLAPENRFLRSATWMAMAADDGACTPPLTDTYARLADGGIGLIIAGFSFVSPEGKGPAGMSGMHSDHVVDGFRQMVDRVHFKGGRIAAQLAHCGAKSSPLPGAGEALGPSDIVQENGTVTVRALREVEIDRIRFNPLWGFEVSIQIRPAQLNEPAHFEVAVFVKRRSGADTKAEVILAFERFTGFPD